MAQYAIPFDLDTTSMKSVGLFDSERTRIYQTEIPQTLAGCGFTAHPQGSLYHTETEHDSSTAIMKLQRALRGNAPNFCEYVRRVHVFRMEEWIDVTSLIANRTAAGPPSSAEEMAANDDLVLAGLDQPRNVRGMCQYHVDMFGKY